MQSEIIRLALLAAGTIPLARADPLDNVIVDHRRDRRQVDGPRAMTTMGGMPSTTAGARVGVTGNIGYAGVLRLRRANR